MVKTTNKKPVEKENLTAFQLKERKSRTCFVGNVPLDATDKQVKRFFVEALKDKFENAVQKVWFRSLPTEVKEESMKTPHRAKIIKNQFGAQKDNKNAYVLLTTKEAAHAAVRLLNQKELLGKHVRVDVDLRETEAGVAASGHDYDSTVFIGNLPFVLNEEDLRAHIALQTKSDAVGLSVGDGILNVRVIRDPKTHLGKGIAYVEFISKPLCRLAIDKLNGGRFQGRELRVKKAVEPKRLEKKKVKKEQKLADRQEERKKAKEDKAAADDEFDQVMRLKENMDAIQSDDSDDNRDGDDSDDDEDRKQRKAKKEEKDELKIDRKSKAIRKMNRHRSDDADFIKNLARIAAKKKDAKQVQDAETGIDITARVAFNKKTMAQIQV